MVTEVQSRITLWLVTLFLIVLPLSQGRSHAPMYDGTDSTLPTNLKNYTLTDRIEHINVGVVDDNYKPLFEGDIPVTKQAEEVIDTSETGDAGSASVEVEKVADKRKAVRKRGQLWTSRSIPVVLTNEVADARNNVLAAITEIQKNSCIRFRDKLPTDQYFIRIVRRNGCSSAVGRQIGTRGGQELSIGPGCNDPGIILHELMHAIGFWHEQARTDRDKYITVIWENIKPGQQKNFNRYNANKLDFVGGAYDFESVMHYGNYAFSKNKKPTMIATKDSNLQFGALRSTLSQTDIMQLQKLYDCEVVGGGWSTWSNWGPCNEQCTQKRERFCTSRDHSKCPGANENGIEPQEAKCQKDECYVEIPGHWGRWAKWGECSRTCGRGYQLRSRLCDNPTPQYGGKLCTGSIAEVQECIKKQSCTGKKSTLWDVITSNRKHRRRRWRILA